MSTKYDATMLVPATCMKRRRENPGPSARPLLLSQVGHSILFFMSASIEQKFEGIQQRPLQILGALLQVAAEQVRDRRQALRGRRPARQRGQVDLIDDRAGVARRRQR